MEKKIREWSSSGLHTACIKILEKFGTLENRDIKILIIGSGMGNFESILLHKYGFLPSAITSCDIDPTNFGVHGITCLKVDANLNLPFSEESFDLIICLEVIEHLENQWNLIREIKRVKKTEGYALISSPNVESVFNKFYFLFTNRLSYFSKKDFEKTGHITPLFSWNFFRMLEKNNLQLLHYDSNLFYFWIIPLFLKIRVPFKSVLFAQLNIFLVK